jgi:hypothetical protein
VREEQEEQEELEEPEEQQDGPYTMNHRTDPDQHTCSGHCQPVLAEDMGARLALTVSSTHPAGVSPGVRYAAVGGIADAAADAAADEIVDGAADGLADGIVDGIGDGIVDGIADCAVDLNIAGADVGSAPTELFHSGIAKHPEDKEGARQQLQALPSRLYPQCCQQLVHPWTMRE